MSACPLSGVGDTTAQGEHGVRGMRGLFSVPAAQTYACGTDRGTAHQKTVHFTVCYFKNEIKINIYGMKLKDHTQKLQCCLFKMMVS